MKWTSTPPEEIGWYWLMQVTVRETTEEVVYVRNYMREMCVSNWSIPYTTKLRKVFWAGPIPSPEPRGVELKIKRRKNDS